MERVRLNGRTRPRRPDQFTPTDRRINRGGRPRGAVNKTTRLLKDAILQAAEEMGEMEPWIHKGSGTLKWKKGKGGTLGYLKWLAANEPKAYSTLLGRVIPLHVVGDIEHTHNVKIGDKQTLLDTLKERGIPIESIYQHRLSPPPIIDGEAVEVEDTNDDE